MSQHNHALTLAGGRDSHASPEKDMTLAVTASEHDAGEQRVTVEAEMKRLATARRAATALELGLAAARCFALCAALKETGNLEAVDERLLNRLRKGSKRTELRDERQLASLRDDALRFEQSLKLRVNALPSPTLTLTTAPTLGTEAQPDAPARKRSRRALLPLPLTALPSAQLLDQLAAANVDWAALLTSPRQTREITLSEAMGDKRLLADFTSRRELLELEGTMSAREATQQVLGREPLKCEVRRTQKLWKQKRDKDEVSPVDGRRQRMTTPFVMVPLVVALTLKHYNGRRRASAAQIAKLVNAEVETLEKRARADGFIKPFPRATPASVTRLLKRIPESMRVVRNKGMDEWAKQHRLVDKQIEALFANHIWEIDHTPLDIAAVLSAEQEDDVVTPHVTACVDAYSGMPMAIFVSSRTPDAFTTSLVLSMAIRPRKIGDVEVGGLPMILRPDHGADFMSSHVGQIAAALPITFDPAAAHNPDGKAHVERFMRTLNQAMAEFPGHKGADGRSVGAGVRQRQRLLTMRQVIEFVGQFATEYAQRRRPDMQCSPVQCFADTVEWRLPENLEELDLLLLKSDEERVLTRQGVFFKGKRYKGRVTTAAGHATQDVKGRRVIIRYHPHSLESIYLYDAKSLERLGEFLQEELWRAEGSASAENKAYIPLLRERTTDFRRHVEREDLAAAAVARAAEREALAKERQEADEKAGVRARTHAETREVARAENLEQRRRDRDADLIDD